MNFELVRVAFPLAEAAVHGISRERLWATPQPDGTYLLDNRPFHVYGVSLGDSVYVTHEGDELIFSSVARRGGHSTYRIKLPRGKTHGYFLELWPKLDQLGCTYEGADDDRRLYAIDIPPAVSVHAIYQVLTGLENAGVLEFEEGYYHDKSKGCRSSPLRAVCQLPV
jgi:hypothetical protein